MGLVHNYRMTFQSKQHLKVGGVMESRWQQNVGHRLATSSVGSNSNGIMLGVQQEIRNTRSPG